VTLQRELHKELESVTELQPANLDVERIRKGLPEVRQAPRGQPSQPEKMHRTGHGHHCQRAAIATHGDDPQSGGQVQQRCFGAKERTGEEQQAAGDSEAAETAGRSTRVGRICGMRSRILAQQDERGGQSDERRGARLHTGDAPQYELALGAKERRGRDRLERAQLQDTPRPEPHENENADPGGEPREVRERGGSNHGGWRSCGHVHASDVLPRRRAGRDSAGRGRP
jgi:hypothetical protein